MDILVVSRQARLPDLLRYHLQPIGFQITHNPDPVDVIDRCEEIEPEMVVFQAEDFPRHWKPLLKLLRAGRSREQCVFVLLKGDEFPFEEAAKANFLEANGIVDSTLPEKELVNRLQELFRRYRSLKDQRKFHRLVPMAEDRLQLLFTNPESMAIVAGQLIEISIQGASFRALEPAMVSGLRRGVELPSCSLRVGDGITSLSARVTRSGEVIGLQFRSFGTGGHHLLFQYIQKRAERGLKKALQEKAGQPASTF